MSTRTGVLAGGNWIVDRVKMIDAWPEQDALATITGQSAANGGGPYNVLKNLARMRAGFPLAGIGLVGADADGDWILDDCRRHGIATGQMQRHPALPTSFTDVMTVAKNGRRTFFHHRGANAALAPRHFDFTTDPSRIFYLGYLLLLDTLDRPDRNGIPAAATVLKRAAQAGMRTMIDTVSAETGRFREGILPCLPHVDLCMMNDWEATRTTGIRLDTPAKRTRWKLAQAASMLFESGVREWVVIHFVEGAFAMHQDGRTFLHGSVRDPEIQGATGAGDAFAAGVLYGWHEDLPMEECLRHGVCVAAASLGKSTCSDGVRPLKACLALGKKLGFRQLEQTGGITG